MANEISRRGNGPPMPGPQAPFLEEDIALLARKQRSTTMPEEDPGLPDSKEHPALFACRKAAEMVRGLQQRHAAEGETLAKHLEQIGEDILQLCKEAAEQVRQHRITPKEHSDQLASDLEHIGESEAERQAKVARGLIAARDAIVGIDQP